MTSPSDPGLRGAGPPIAVSMPGRRYWHAQEFADVVLGEFNAARSAHDLAAVREHFYVLAAYYRRTLSILHSALEGRREPLAAAALENLIILQRTLAQARQVAPDTSLSTLALETSLRRRVNQDLVYRIVRDARGALGLATIVRRFNDLDVFADARRPAIAQALLTLVQTGHIIESDGRYRPTTLPYVDANVDQQELAILLGPALSRDLRNAGFEGVSSVLEQREAFMERLREATGFSTETCTLAVACAEVMSESAEPIHGARRWPHAELASSTHPRPYQRLLHAILRAHRYAGKVIEAPAGSGKTLVGMLCVEDWLRTLAPGHSILVLVPTASYERQWVGELCIKPVGLRLAPHLVVTGTPGTIAAQRTRGLAPTILVMTYAALARLGSGEGRGGFDSNAIERFLQANNVRHVIFDEVHKVAADLGSATANTTRVLMRWLKDGSLASIIGFSGTVSAYERRLDSLGLSLVSVVPSKELIAQGWVAPYAEFGAPFSYSERERRIVALIDEYREHLRHFLARLDPVRVRDIFTSVPLQERARIAAALGMYRGRREAAELIESRLRGWESGLALGLGDAFMVSIVQIATAWSDRRLVREAGNHLDAAQALTELARVRLGLQDEPPPGQARRLVSAEGFGETLDPGVINKQTVREVLATTAVGCYLAIRGWSRQAGEGRVAVVRAIIEAERRERAVSGVIIFDTPAPLKWREGTATPGYRGAAAMFVELADDSFCVPIAALGSELYVPDDLESPLHERIAAWLFRRIVIQEQGAALFQIIATGSGLGEQEQSLLRPVFEKAFEQFALGLRDGGAATLAEFDQQLFHPLRQFVHQSHTQSVHPILSWLSIGQHHIRSSVAAILDYLAIARAFRTAQPIDVVRGDGTTRRIRVVPAGSGRRRQLLLDLTARLVDADDLPIDVVIVSSWARTGWNVLTPNVLIDATATRDVTAWRQLRGRAMRPSPRWSADAQRLVRRLIGLNILDEGEDSPTGIRHPTFDELPPEERRILAGAVETGPPLTGGETAYDREALAAAVMQRENKVTHIYELVSARGTNSQVEYHRASRTWERNERLAEKHRHESAVSATDGELRAGPAHAPLIVANDPRYDAPEAFLARLAVHLKGADARIVSGWLHAGSHPTHEQA